MARPMTKPKFTIYSRKWTVATFKGTKYTAIEMATMLLQGNYPADETEVRDDTGAVVWSSRQQTADDRWARLRSFIETQMSGIEGFQLSGVGNYRQGLQAYQAVLDRMTEIEDADGKTE